MKASHTSSTEYQTILRLFLLQSFRWFSEAGDWENCMTTWSRLMCIYTGAVAMWAIGARLKHRYVILDCVLYKNIVDAIY